MQILGCTDDINSSTRTAVLRVVPGTTALCRTRYSVVQRTDVQTAIGPHLGYGTEAVSAGPEESNCTCTGNNRTVVIRAGYIK